METKSREESIEKYLNALRELHTILSYTGRLSMEDFKKKNNLSHNFSRVLSKGGVISCSQRGRYGEWKWCSIAPTKQMAIKTLDLISQENPERPKVKKQGGKREGSGRKTKAEELRNAKVKSYELRLFWGLTKVKINPVYV